MRLARLWRVLLLAAFLVAQQSALAHQLWHLSGDAQQAQGKQPEKSKSDPLCGQHSALSTVLGALNGSTAAALFIDSAPLNFAAAHSPVASTPAPPPASRGPPHLR